MSCTLTRQRAEACKDSVAGIKEIYFANFDALGTVTLTDDEVTNMTGDSGAITLHKYPLKGNNSFETTINASRENGTTFYEQTLTITLKKLTKEDHKELKLLSAARPHIFVVDRNDNVFLMGLVEGADLSEGTVSSGNALGDFNGYSYTFTAQEVSPPNFVNSAGPGTADFPVDSMAGITSATITAPTVV